MKNKTLAEEHEAYLREQLRVIQDNFAELLDRSAQMESRLKMSEETLSGIYKSLSWCLTAPLRKTKFVLKQYVSLRKKPNNPYGRVQKLAKRGLYSLLLYIRSRPKVAACLIRICSRMPFIYKRLKIFYHTRGSTQSEIQITRSPDHNSSTPGRYHFRERLERELKQRRQRL